MPNRNELSPQEAKAIVMPNWVQEINGLSEMFNTYVNPYLLFRQEKSVTDVGPGARGMQEAFGLRLGLGPCMLTLVDYNADTLRMSQYAIGSIQDNLPRRNRLCLRVSLVNADMFKEDVLSSQQDVYVLCDVQPALVDANGIEFCMEKTKKNGLVVVTTRAPYQWDAVSEHAESLVAKAQAKILHNEEIKSLLAAGLWDKYITVLQVVA